MKTFTAIILLVISSCASAPKQEPGRPNYGGALSEIYRRGDPSQTTYNAYAHKDSYSCVSTPVYAYDTHGNAYYLRTNVSCN